MHLTQKCIKHYYSKLKQFVLAVSKTNLFEKKLNMCMLKCAQANKRCGMKTSKISSETQRKNKQKPA